MRGQHPTRQGLAGLRSNAWSDTRATRAVARERPTAGGRRSSVTRRLQITCDRTLTMTGRDVAVSREPHDSAFGDRTVSQKIAVVRSFSIAARDEVIHRFCAQACGYRNAYHSRALDGNGLRRPAAMQSLTPADNVQCQSVAARRSSNAFRDQVDVTGVRN